MNLSRIFFNKIFLISFSFCSFGQAKDRPLLIPEELAKFDHSSQLYKGFESYQTFLFSWLTQAQNVFKQLGVDPENEEHSKQLYIALKALLDFCEKDGQVLYKGLIPLHDWKKNQLTTLLDKVTQDEDPFLSGLLLALNVPLSQETQKKIRQNKESKVQQKILRAYLSSQKQAQTSSLSKEGTEKKKTPQELRSSYGTRGSRNLRTAQTPLDQTSRSSQISQDSKTQGVRNKRTLAQQNEPHRGPQWRRYTKGSAKWQKYRQYQSLIGN